VVGNPRKRQKDAARGGKQTQTTTGGEVDRETSAVLYRDTKFTLALIAIRLTLNPAVEDRQLRIWRQGFNLFVRF
jgi:hypothetical protein